jgi:hypothetical protein
LESRQTFAQKLVLTLWLLLIASLLAIVCSLMYLLTLLMQIIGRDNGTEDYQNLSTYLRRHQVVVGGGLIGILHIIIIPAYKEFDVERIAIHPVLTGPNNAIRCLNVFRKKG